MLKHWRKLQTPFLAILTFAVFVWAAINVFDIDKAVIYLYLSSEFLLVALLVISAVIVVTLLKLFKRSQ